MPSTPNGKPMPPIEPPGVLNPSVIVLQRNLLEELCDAAEPGTYFDLDTFVGRCSAYREDAEPVLHGFLASGFVERHPAEAALVRVTVTGHRQRLAYQRH